MTAAVRLSASSRRAISARGIWRLGAELRADRAARRSCAISTLPGVVGGSVGLGSALAGGELGKGRFQVEVGAAAAE